MQMQGRDGRRWWTLAAAFVGLAFGAGATLADNVGESETPGAQPGISPVPAVAVAAGPAVRLAQADTGRPAVGALLRFNIDGQPGASEVISSYGVETMLEQELQYHGYRVVDLTPLHDDFQQLRYTHTCPYVSGASSPGDCAEFGSYAEAVLQVLENIDYARQSGILALRPQDYILIADASIRQDARRVQGTIALRIRRVSGDEIVVGHVEPVTARIGTAPVENVIRNVASKLVIRSVKPLSR